MLQTDKTPEQIAAIHALWNVGILSWKLWPQQLPIYNAVRDLPDDIDEAVVLCARQYGKSVLGVLLAIEDCIRVKNVCVLIVGPTIKQARNIVAPRLKMLAKDAPHGLIRQSKSEGKWFIGESELVIGGFDQNSGSERGKTLYKVYVEEIVDSDADKYVDSMTSDIGPALTHSIDPLILYLTTLPKVPDHPFIIDTMAKAILNNALYRFTIDQNKALSQRQYDACVRRSGGKHTEAYKREYLCEAVRDRSIVIIPDFSDETHVADFNLPQDCNMEIVMDWGGVRDMTVAHLMTYEFLTGRDLFYKELYWPANTPSQVVIDDLQEWFDGYDIKNFYADAPGQLQVDMIKTHKLAVKLPQKDNWEASINNTANRFTTNNILIHPSCKLTIQTCRSGIFNKQRTDFARSKTLGHMDAIASLMYGVRSIDRSSPFPEVVGSDGWQYRPPSQQQDQNIMPAKGFTPKGFKKFGG